MGAFLAFLLARLTEPSTYAGLGAIAASVGAAVSNPNPTTIGGAAIAALSGVAGVALKEGAATVSTVATTAAEVISAVTAPVAAPAPVKAN